VYGGISGIFDHATNTEEFLVGKSLNDQAVIQEAIGVLAAEVEPEFDYVLSSVEYRKHLAQAMFYKVTRG
jgi:xanthine dehydrogenase/oxidase